MFTPASQREFTPANLKEGMYDKAESGTPRIEQNVPTVFTARSDQV